MSLGDINNMLKSGLNRDSFGADGLSSFLCSALQGVILSHSLFESLSALGFPGVLDSNMESLGKDVTSDLFVNDHSD